MTGKEQSKAAKEFAKYWEGKGYEKGESQKFWIDLLQNVFGVENATRYISFEDQVHLDHTSFIDGYISATKVMIEQKSLGKDLRKAIKQSDGTFLNPFQQAKRYVTELPVSQHPRWIITCNFAEFLVYDMEKPNGEPEQIFLKDLPKEYYRLQFLVDTGNHEYEKEMQISKDAGKITEKLYDALKKQYQNPDAPDSLKSLNMLCVRLVFCFYAESAGVFEHGLFKRYMRDIPVNKWHRELHDVFRILDTPNNQRDPYDTELNVFPYVNGGLFTDKMIEIPRFTQEIADIVLNEACAFDWQDISPTIFGAIFESTLNADTRRSGGMHYTSIENIHKVIDPLFLDGLHQEFEELKDIKRQKDGISRQKLFADFHKKLGSLVFFDPACGSGNFLTESYISLRKLENELIALEENLVSGQHLLDTSEEISPIQVSISQFYGIEINDFAVSVAKTALWIAELQMMQKTQELFPNYHFDFLPLRTNAFITEGNALRIDWESVVPKEKLSYIMGNPPFVGFTYMDKTQKEDMSSIFGNVKNLDFVCAWYKKASDYITNTTIEVAFVSTNSITQGETVARFWDFMKNDIINFAYKTFVWNSEASIKAHVHCIIIGFSKISRKRKLLFDNSIVNEVNNINPYLVDAPNILVNSRNTPICNVPKMIYGNKPADGGFLIIEEDEYDEFIKKNPKAISMIKPLLGAQEYIRGKKRYCLWLVGVSPKEIAQCSGVLERVKKCQETRLASVAKAIQKFAETPSLFAQRTQPTDVDFIIVPRVSSENRRYIPIGFINAGTIVTDAVQIIPDATLYHFGVLTSNVHMAWMRTVCGRLKSDYRYSKDVVYNNFPWCNPDDKQKILIEKTAQAILDARAKYPDCSLADLYNETTMPPELRKAHQANDKAVMIAYGFDYKTMTESECVAELMKMYQKLTEEK